MADQQPLLNPSEDVSSEDDAIISEHNNQDTTVGILDVFRFADLLDYFLMFISVCFIMMQVICTITNMIRGGQLAGLFVIKAFTDTCNHQHTNSSLRLFHPNVVIFSSTIITVAPTFRENVMNIVYSIIIINILKIFSYWMSVVIWMIAIQRQTSKMNIHLFRSLLQRNISYFDTNTVNQFNAELFTNIEKIQSGVGVEFVLLLTMMINMMGSFIVSLVISWHISLILLVLLILIFPISFMLTKITANETSNMLKTNSKVGKIIIEVFSSLRTILSLNGSSFEQKRYEKELHQIRWNSLRKGAAVGLWMGCLFLMTYIVYPIVFIFGSIFMLYDDQKRLTIVDILVIVSIFGYSLRFFGYTGNYLQAYSEAHAAATPVLRLIDQSQHADINELDIWKEDDPSIDNINHDIEFRNVNFIYPSRNNLPVLQNLSFIARAGKTTAIVGSSGSGKSTCISLLLRQYELSSGRIKIGDKSITNYNVKELRQNIGVVSQEPILFGMSIYENIRMGKINAIREEIEEAARQANAHDFIMILPRKYETYVGERGIQLSGGEKQRIALARALVKQPSILLLDEATSALDNLSEKIVQQAIDQTSKNRTTIVIAHRLSTIQNADQIYVLENGSVLEEGTHETLMMKNEGKYQTMVKRQQLEKTKDEEDDLLSVEQGTEKEQQFISEYSDSPTPDSKPVDVNKSVFRRLLSMNKPEWMIILFGCIMCAMNGAIQTVLTILIGVTVGAFNYCLYPDSRHRVLKFSIIFLILSILLLILRFLQCATFALSGARLIERIRLKAFECLLRQEIGYYDRPENSSSAISVRLSSDASTIEQMIGVRLGLMCEVFALLCFGLLFGLIFNWQLTMIVLLTAIIIIGTAFFNVRSTVYLKKQSGPLLQRANTFAVEAIYHIRTVKQLAVEKKLLQEYSDLMYRVFKSSLKPIFISTAGNCIVWGFDTFSLAFLYWCGLILFEDNKLTSKDIVMIISFVIFATQSLKFMIVFTDRASPSFSAAQNFFDLFDRIPNIDNTSTNGQELIDFRGEIEFNQVKFAYPTTPTSAILKKFDLTIKPGQRVALVGTSGCGKSTIIQLLERFYDVTQGQLLLDGVDIRELNIQWVRSRLGLVSQEPVLFDLTIAENISYGLENIPIESIINAAIKANIHQFIEQLPQGYETRVGVKGCFLSGGEKKRIAIARVLLRQPKVLLLDEATSALDSYNERIIQETLDQAQVEDRSRTSLIIAHRLSTIRSCDLICVLHRGHIVENGNHAELVQRHGFYYRMLTQNSSY